MTDVYDAEPNIKEEHTRVTVPAEFVASNYTAHVERQPKVEVKKG